MKSSRVLAIGSAVVGLGFGAAASLSTASGDVGAGALFVVVALFIGGIAATLGVLMRAIAVRRMH